MKIKEKLLLIEDERTIRGFMQAILTANGYDVLMAGTGAMANTMISSHCPDLIILDLGLPDMDGMTILQSVRQWSKVPIIVVSARSHERDKVAALDAGADDYLTKPFGIMELAARIKALLRRTGRSTSDSASDKITAGGITVNTSLREVSRDGRPIELTLKEYELLLYLLKNRARVVSREELLTKVWGIDFVGETRTLDMHIGTLRKKLSDDAENAHLIKTVRGVGYRFIGE